MTGKCVAQDPLGNHSMRCMALVISLAVCTAKADEQKPVYVKAKVSTSSGQLFSIDDQQQIAKFLKWFAADEKLRVNNGGGFIPWSPVYWMDLETKDGEKRRIGFSQTYWREGEAKDGPEYAIGKSDRERTAFYSEFKKLYKKLKTSRLKG